MVNDQKSLAEELGLLFRLLLVGFVLSVLLIVYLDWRPEDHLRYRLPQISKTTEASISLDESPQSSTYGNSVYVPVYSHIYHDDGRAQLLTVTLSVRNTDRNNEILLASVSYYDSRGKQVKSHLDIPFRLGPLATTEFLIERDDAVGGSGASFVVEWVASQKVTEPIVEAVMIGTDRHQGISFARRGTVIEELRSHDE